MSTINLRNMDDARRNDLVNAEIAIIAGWTDVDMRHDQGLRLTGFEPLRGPHASRHWVPSYATSADAVIPLLSKCDWWNANFASRVREFTVEVDLNSNEEREGLGKADSFPLASCLALLRANGYEVLT